MSKQCEIVQDLIPLYVDGACSEASAEMIKEHLANCAHCREIYQQMNSNVSEAVLKEEKDGVIERHEKAEKKKIRRRIILFSVLSVILCFVIIFICISLKPATIDYGNSEVYSKEDMDCAIELIKTIFSSWDECKLYSISYTDDGLCQRELEYCNTLADEGVVYTECMVFRTRFRTSIFAGYSWNANFEYNWSWYFAKTENGTWELLTWGVP